MWARFSFFFMPEMSQLHVCVDLSFDLSGRLMEIYFLAGCTFFTGVSGGKKCLVSSASTMA